MNGSAAISTTDACLKVAGALDFASVVSLQAEGERWLREQAASSCCVDLAGVTFSNSAGTALLLAWMRAARTAEKTLHIEHPPANLVAMIQLGGLEDVLLK